MAICAYLRICSRDILEPLASVRHAIPHGDYNLLRAGPTNLLGEVRPVAADLAVLVLFSW